MRESTIQSELWEAVFWCEFWPGFLCLYPALDKACFLLFLIFSVFFSRILQSCVLLLLYWICPGILLHCNTAPDTLGPIVDHIKKISAAVT